MSATVDGVARWADVSDDGLYRYDLTRRWSGSPRTAQLVLWIMLNPSTANGLADDPTIRRCVGYARRWGYDGIQVVNLYAWRSTSPAAMLLDQRQGYDITGPENDGVIAWALARAAATDSIAVAAWGTHGHGSPRVDRVLELVEAHGVPLQALKVTKGGDPGHPLYVKADATLQPWPMP